MPQYTVCGYWADTEEREVEVVTADNVYKAEWRILARADQQGGDFRPAGTLLGQFAKADTYSAFVDPEDLRNLERGLAPAVDGPAVEEWTVLGVILAKDRHHRHWNAETGGQRWLSHEMATSALAAEDVARSKNTAGNLVVCAVFAGALNRCENFPFSNPDRRVG